MNILDSFWKVRKSAVYLVTASFFALNMMAHAAPTGGVVAAGQAAINQSGSSTTINQSTQNASINWQGFSVGSTETVNFIQPNISSITLNRVVGNEQSIINGSLNANGQVFILNSNGILFGRGASINTAGLVATTMSLSDADFMAGKYSFKDASYASVINLGTINITDGGYAALLAKDVENEGTITALKGTIQMTGADSTTINLNGNSLVSLTVDKGVIDALVSNKGAVIAEGGQIYLTANAADELLKSVVNNEGLLEAESLGDFKGSIIVYAHGGTTDISGTLNAEGGFIETSGKELNIASGTVVKAADWLIDPVDINISMAGADGVGGSDISGATIDAYLAGTGNLTLNADNDININDNIDYSGTTSTLSLNAGHDINLNAYITTGDNTISLNYGNALNFNVENMGFAIMASGINTTADTVSMNGYEYSVLNTAADFQNMKDDLDGRFVLGSDVTVSSIDEIMIGSGSNPQWYAGSFTGTLNGFGHTVTYDNVDAGSQEGVGLFGTLGPSAVVSDMTITGTLSATDAQAMGGLAGFIFGMTDGVHNPSINNIVLNSLTLSSWSENIGGLAGMVSYSDISNIGLGNVSVDSSSGSYTSAVAGYAIESDITGIDIFQSEISGGDSVGGVVGYGSGVNISNVDITYLDIDGSENVGGVAGETSWEMDSNVISDVSAQYVTIDASNGQSIGGIVGEGQSIDITNADVQDLVIEPARLYAGGIAGHLVYGTITDSGVITADIKSDKDAGGIVGFLDHAGVYGSTVSDVDVFAEEYGAGGIAGGIDNYSVIKDSYVSASDIGATAAMGGIYGYAGMETPVDIINSYYQMSTTNLGYIDGSLNNTGYITTGFLEDNFWSYYRSTNSLDPTIMGVWSPNGDGDYEVSTVAQFKMMAQLGQTEFNYVLTADIDLDTAAGLYIPLLKGNLDGGGHTVSNMDITNLKFNGGIGLAGTIIGGSITDVNVHDSRVDGVYSVGIVAGAVLGSYDSSFENVIQASSLSDITVTESSGGISYNITADSLYPHKKGFGTVAGTVMGGTEINNVDSSVDMLADESLENFDLNLDNVGGLIGGVINEGGSVSIVNSTYEGDINLQFSTGSNRNVNINYVGGLIGTIGDDYYGSNNTITNSYATGDINIDHNGYLNLADVGGQFGTIAKTTVSGMPTVGGNAAAEMDINILAESETAYVSEIGGFAGYMDSVTMSDINIETDISVSLSKDYSSSVSSVGVFAGSSINTVIDAVFKGSLRVIGDTAESIGGFLGSSESDTITGVNVNNTNVTAFGIDANNVSYIGGLIGDSYYSSITNSSASLDINLSSTNTAENIGGLIGYVSGDFDNPYEVDDSFSVSGNHLADAYALANTRYNLDQYIADGWLVEFYPYYYSGQDETEIEVYVLKPSQVVGSVVDSHSSGEITVGGDAEYVGGLIGYAEEANITSSHSNVNISIDGTGEYVGGLLGYSEGYQNDTSESAETYVAGDESDVLAYITHIDNVYDNAGYTPDGDAYYYYDDEAGAWWLEKEYAIEYSLGNIVNSYAGTTLSPVSITIGTSNDTDAQYIGGLVGYIESASITGSSAHSDTEINIGGGTSEYVGGLIGYAEEAELTGASTTGSITIDGSGGFSSINSVGGLIGYVSDAAVSSSTTANDLDIIGDGLGSVGGFIGAAYSTEISSSHATGSTTVDGTDLSSIGGFAGNLSDSQIIDSSQTGDIGITSDDSIENIGGMFGYGYTVEMTDSSSEGDITVAGDQVSYVGGFSGYASYGEFSGVSAEGDISVTGTVLSTLGGVAGYIGNAEIDNASFSGSFVLDGDETNSLGGLFGTGNALTLTNSSYDKNISVVGDVINGVGGIVATSNGLILNNVSYTGDITLNGDTVTGVGGIVGSINMEIDITDTYFEGNIDVTATSEANNIGGFAGYAISWGTFNSVSVGDSYAAGNITVHGGATANMHEIGGLFGDLNGLLLENVSYEGDISLSGSIAQNVGGMFGRVYWLEMNNSYAEGALTVHADSSYNVGGLAGHAFHIDVDKVYADVDVSATKLVNVTTNISNIGGFAGQLASSQVNEAYSAGNVVGYDYTGGFAGLLIGNESVISNTFAWGSVTGGNYVGGLIGSADDATIEYTYSSGLVTATGSNVGGLVGENLNSSTITDSFYDNTVNPDFEDVEGYGRSTVEMQGLDLYSDAGWNVEVNEDIDGYAMLTFDDSGAVWHVSSTGSGGGTGGGDTGGGDTGGGDTGGGDTGGGDTGGGDTGGGDTGGGGTNNAPVQEAVTSVVTSIVNQSQVSTGVNVANIIQSIAEPVILSSVTAPSTLTITNPQSAGFVEGLGFEQGSVVSVVSSPTEGQESFPVSLGELILLGGGTADGGETSGNESTAGGAPQNYTVRLGQDSIVDLVNGGINLPEGVQQEYYLVGTPATRERQQ